MEAKSREFLAEGAELCNRSRVKQAREVPCAVNHPDDVDAAGDLTVEDQVAPDRKIAEIGTDVRAGRTKAWMLGKQMAFRIDLIENAVGRRRIVLGDIDPEFDEILFRSVPSG